MRLLHVLDEGIRIAIESLRANPLRTGLTVLGVAIGVSVVVTMAALITGVRSSVLEGFEAAGPRNFIVARVDLSEVRLVGDGSRPAWWDRPPITARDAAEIARLPGVGEAVVSFDFTSSMAYRGRRVAAVESGGRTEGWPAYSPGRFVGGRNFVGSEVRQSRSVVVLSSALADELFGALDPVGRSIRVGTDSEVRERFTVVGVYEMDAPIFAEAIEHVAIFPHTTAAERLGASDDFLNVFVVPREDAALRPVMDRVTGRLRALRGLGPGEENDFSLIRSQQLVELFDQLTGVFFLVMLALSSVGLLVGGVGVVGIMLISVTERTREIGIRKAVGARRGEILWQFLVEASVLTLAGGALGLGLGAAAAEAVAAFTPVPARIPLWSVFAALAMAVVTGMLFGLLPAVRAARMDPVTALRQE